ncbi:hypothetical protein F0562_025595 [Nyssa sinensis]|uniref:Dynamin-type G domain-containing protein n=1 Tax=Nyssa sinensis TaxID=561372 RepID=A0A5J5B6P6_9ASTE|nr:hypothetical protein F0562_025595 [Nyssa sinensis]
MAAQDNRNAAENNAGLLQLNTNISDDEEYSSALDNVQPLSVVLEETPLCVHAPLVMSYNDRIRPLLDAVDKLRHLKVTQEGIQLPTIVVVGDQSSGKSSVLESLAGINLPRGQGICTRVPLIMRLQHQPDPHPELFLEFHGKKVPTDEAHVSNAINEATKEIAGDGKGISHTPLTLVVKKNGVPDLTMVDLPGITRVPVHGQPDDIYEQISAIIMEMSQRVDKTGLRTLAVVTKADKAPEGLLEKVTADDVNIGLGYVCVRNRIGDESYEDARIEEARLFNTHPLLSKIDKSMVGIPVLAQKLVQIQATSISKWLPDIVREIGDKLNTNVSELKKMPQKLFSVAEAMIVFMQIVGSSKESLRKILVRGEFDEYPDEKHMHCTARLAEMLNQYSLELQKSAENGSSENFLMEEITVLEEAKGIWLPNFLPRTAFLMILRRKVVAISKTPVEFVAKVWNYIETVVLTVLMYHSENYPQLQSCTRRAAQNLIAKMKERLTQVVMDIVEMEKLTDYTCDPEYMTVWRKLMGNQTVFNEVMNSPWTPRKMRIEGFGEIEVEHLRLHPNIRDQAFDLKMRITAYWKIVLKRLVDSMALHSQLSIQMLVNKDMEMEIVNELMGSGAGGIEMMLEESPSVANKRERLNKSIKLLQDSKEIVAKIMDRIAIDRARLD